MDGLIYTQKPRLRRIAALLLGSSCVVMATSTPVTAAALSLQAPVTARAQTKQLPQTLRAFGQIEPMVVIQVRAVNLGTVNGLSVVPGSVVTAGQVLARIGGPRMQSLLISREQSLQSARAREDSATRALDIVRHQFSAQLATHQAVDAAQSELAAAHAAVQTADAQLHEAKDLQTVRAPAAGTVVAVQAANGESTTADETLITLQPADKLWIRATYYGADAASVRVGMTGRFQPSGDGKAITVKVAAIAPGLAADSGLSVGLLPTHAEPTAGWMNGQWGTVILEGVSRRMIAVPTDALVLDRGKWWVLVRTPQGDRPQQVIPGPSRGWQTWIESGLEPGQQIVTQDAFLEYHRSIAQSYRPPD